MMFQFTLETRWPPGAWLARGVTGQRGVRVRHGSSVATHGDWFGEIVWDGDYRAAGFDATDLVYGTGGKRTDDATTGGGVRFVASSATTDRLQHAELGGVWWVSNSLACLAAATGAEFDPLHGRHRAEFGSIVRGLDRHARRVATRRVPIELTYVDHLVADASGLRRSPAPAPRRDFSTYDRYRGFLEDALARIAANMAAPERPRPYAFLGTLSTGFDSPTVAALASGAGLREVLTFATARDGADDDGTAIAERLGLATRVRDRDAWRRPAADHAAADHAPVEPLFLASDAKGEDVYFSGAADLLPGRVLLTGYAAGAWGPAPRANPQLRRADQSGLSLTEYRLHADFLHLPAPTMGVRGMADDDLRRLAAELRPWASGKKYDKPFCRRVLTEAGVPDDLFGREKKAASVLVFDRRSLLSPASLADYRGRLRRARRRDPWNGVRGVVRGLAWRVAGGGALLLRAAAGALSRVAPLRTLRRVAASDRLKEHAYYEPLCEHLFPWAVAAAERRYPGAASANHPVQEGEQRGERV